ncbi:hypothetical protein K450DRAFT_241267 [Umbelopsis ramanniana AG]|uniref:Uncharacterized protein n=1 Tax=Umbelopsis ramanniana AG TaxID=1314678 RepID=A0AAD5HD34_UMBRA|nr:uncharacterized protein K450DRAFT_241267 [Umbelopsis ramanniana AG]KAI8579737.1 hypothetical protein K450DRAFT_241267 [Umbelopsis ramanniana AG]
MVGFLTGEVFAVGSWGCQALQDGSDLSHVYFWKCSWKKANMISVAFPCGPIVCVHGWLLGRFYRRLPVRHLPWFLEWQGCGRGQR